MQAWRRSRTSRGLVILGFGGAWLTAAPRTLTAAGPEAVESATAPLAEQQSNAQGSDLLRRLREAGQPLLRELAEQHGYHLLPAENLRRIAPPYADVRADYYRIGHPSQAEAIPRGPDGMIFHWRDDQLENWGMTFCGGPDKGYSLTGLVDGLTGIESQSVEGPPELLSQSIEGDWVVRPDASPVQVFAELQSILQKEVGRPISLSYREIERPVYVAEGDYRLTPLPGQQADETLILTDETLKTDPVAIFGEELVPDSGAGGGTGPLDEFLSALGRWVKRPIVADVKTLPARQISWSFHEQGLQTESTRRAAHDPTLVLANITRQTGLTFREDVRKVKILFVAEVKAR